MKQIGSIRHSPWYPLSCMVCYCVCIYKAAQGILSLLHNQLWLSKLIRLQHQTNEISIITTDCIASSEQQDIGKNTLDNNATTSNIQKPRFLYRKIAISNEHNLQHTSQASTNVHFSFKAISSVLLLYSALANLVMLARLQWTRSRPVLKVKAESWHHWLQQYFSN